MDQLIEIRNYTLKPGTQAHFDLLMQQQSLPLLRAAGTDVVCARASLHAPLAYVLIRAYPGLAARSASQDAFYTSAAWLSGPCAAVMACIDSYSTVVLDASAATIDGLRARSRA